jgi:translocator assembly and maintenance protein 41
MATVDLLQDEGFPPVQFAFAYGSGAVAQAGYDPTDRPMLDLVLVVDDPLEWHRLNLIENAHHYSILGMFGPRLVGKVQDMPADVYYNTLTPMKGATQKGRLMKYGVVGLREFQRDLQDWQHLYLAGRLHKPVVFLKQPSSKLGLDLVSNLTSAVRTSLLLLPDRFSKEELYLTVARLSYDGDFRMVFGENPDKVRNIVLPNIQKFDGLYAPVMENLTDACSWSNSGSEGGFYEQDMSTSTRKSHASMLPASLQLFSKGAVDASTIQAQLRSIVFRSSLMQSAKGVLTAGPAKATQYTGAKVGKWASWWIRHLRGR